MSLRIGYVNVQGLDRGAWKACQEMLEARFDYLFLAETWFSNHDQYKSNRRLISTTPQPVQTLQPGRSHGGIYLIRTYRGRSRVQKVKATTHSITFTVGKETISGVYFPPKTMSTSEMTRILDSLKYSTIILGDINTRFQNPVWQEGQPGPADRRGAIEAFLVQTDFEHLKPRLPGLKLTTDHCFVRRSKGQPVLELVPNRTFKTDHKYTLGITISPGQVVPGNDVARFRIGRLAAAGVQDLLCQRIRGYDCPFTPKDPTEVMNRKLVRWCQLVLRQTVGQQARGSSDAPPEAGAGAGSPSSARLYKQACKSSKENRPIIPTPRAREKEIDVVAENLAIFEERWQGSPFRANDLESDETAEAWSREQLCEEIRLQAADKSCGADGVHIQFLKSALATPLIDWLLVLYNTCRRRMQTPLAWNQSEIYLLDKDPDPDKPRDADNLRPISIICIFRKVFERLLLLDCQHQSWAQLHRGQAGFRRTYSTLSNVAVVHALLVSKERSIACFLDLKSAFDVVDHTLLDNKLARRGCLANIRQMLRGLMFTGLESRLLINDIITEWFPRTQGILQGSPLSPWLFNIFINDLLEELNNTSEGVPWCLFYADDGVLLVESQADLLRLMKIIEGWTVSNRIMLNPKKCGIVTSLALDPVCVYSEEIPVRAAYKYLGFPVTRTGVDFKSHLQLRIKAALHRMAYLGSQSDSWVPANRLGIFKQFLSPMFEYGAPLLWAWAQEHPKDFEEATKDYDQLIKWIANTATTRCKLTANIFGLPSFSQRLQLLHLQYQLNIEQMPRESPLRQLLRYNSCGFITHLQTQLLYDRFKQTSTLQPTIPIALSRFAYTTKKAIIDTNSKKAHLTKIIPLSIRSSTFIDISLTAPAYNQVLLLQYRRGVFMHGCKCVCKRGERFKRGHEEKCPTWKHLVRLSRKERVEKRLLRRELGLSNTILFTTIDFWLSTRQIGRVAKVLLTIRDGIREVWAEDTIETGSLEDSASDISIP
jgi:hypothetical protein